MVYVKDNYYRALNWRGQNSWPRPKLRTPCTILHRYLCPSACTEYLTRYWPIRPNTQRNLLLLFLVWLLQVKCQEVAIDGISDLKESVDVKIRGVKRSLEDDLTFVQDGENFLNKRMRTTDRLQNSFEGFQHKVHDIWQELFCLAIYAFEVKPTLAKWTNFHSIPKITS